MGASFRLNMRDPFNTDFKITTREPSFVLQNPEDDNKMKAHSSRSSNMTPRTLSANVLSALQGVRFIAQHISDADKDNEVIIPVYVICLYLVVLDC